MKTENEIDKMLRRARNAAVAAIVFSSLSLILGIINVSYRAGHKAGMQEKCPIEIPGSKIEKNIDKDFWL